MSAHFHHLFEIETDTFTSVAPRPNAINENIGGDELASWLHARLLESGYTCSEIEPEDHGWDFDVTHEGRRDRVVSAGELEAEGVMARWHAVQVAQTRGEAAHPDPLLGDVRALLAENANFVVVADETRHRR